ncbi:hypothetical protein BH11BAC4_BH11BAC4_05990 [soil metagenome]
MRFFINLFSLYIMTHLHILSKTIGLPGTISGVLNNIRKQQKFLGQYIAPILKDAISNNDGSLGDADIKKINGYYGLAVPAILGEAFCVLHGNEMSLAARWASTCQGAMTGLFDDFFDKDYLSDDAVEQLIKIDKTLTTTRSNQKLFDIFYKKALENAPDKKLLQDALFDVYKAQVESKKQEAGGLSTEELKRITFYKGGSSALFYHTVFSPEAIGKEKKLLYDLGAVMQLANDIFDVYKDREAGIQTLVTDETHIGKLRSLFSNKLKEHYTDAFNLGYPQKNTHKFLNILSIGIFSRCFVCLDQLEQNEKLTGNVFDVKKYSRQQLICDMDTKMNMLRSAKKHVAEVPWR